MLFFVLVFILVVGSDMGGRGAELHLGILAILDFLAFRFLAAWVVSLLASLPWWYRINRELRDLEHSYDARTAGSQPLWSLLMMTVGWLVLLPPFIAVFRTCRRIQRAQTRAGQPETLSSWVLTPSLLLHPLLFSYLQHELNRIWAVEGEPLDPWPADASKALKRSTGTMPWLKGLSDQPTGPAGS